MFGKSFFILFLCAFLLIGACPVQRAVGGSPDKILKKEGWELKIWFTAKGSRSEGRVSRLFHDGKEVCPRTEGELLNTAIGKMFYENSRYPWGWHGWRPVSSE